MRRLVFGPFFGALLVFFVALFAHGAVSNKLVNPVGYDSLDKAGVAALMAARSQKSSGRYEYGGCLYMAGGLYYYTTPVTDRDTGEFSAACNLVTTDKFVGIFHNHPWGSKTGFSGGDVNMANQLSVASYLLIDENTTREIVRYVPGKTKIECYVFRSGEVTPDDLCARGDLVSKF